MNEQIIEAKHEYILRCLAILSGCSYADAKNLLNRDFFSGLGKRAVETWLFKIVLLLGKEDGRQFIKARRFCLNHKASTVGWLLEFLNQEGLTEDEAKKIIIGCPELTSSHRHDVRKAHKTLCQILPNQADRRELIKAHPNVYLMPSACLKRKRNLHWTGDPDAFWDELQVQGDNLNPETNKPILHANDWQSDLRIAVLQYNPEWDDEKWRQFATKHSWIFDRHGTSPKVLDEIATWLDLPTVQHWSEESARFIVKICTDEKLHSILRLSHQAIYCRLYVLRRYLGVNFQSKPEALLQAWEALTPEEIRYRSNEIQARGFRSDFLPWQIVLPTVDRETFINRIQAYGT